MTDKYTIVLITSYFPLRKLYLFVKEEVPIHFGDKVIADVRGCIPWNLSLFWSTVEHGDDYWVLEKGGHYAKKFYNTMFHDAEPFIEVFGKEKEDVIQRSAIMRIAGDYKED